MAYRNYVLVCGGTGCESSKADQIFQNLKASAEAHNIYDEVQIIKTGCFGFCEQGPIVKILPEETFYVEVTPDDAEEIISEHLVKGREVTRILYDRTKSTKNAKFEDLDFYQNSSE